MCGILHARVLLCSTWSGSERRFGDGAGHFGTILNLVIIRDQKVHEKVNSGSSCAELCFFLSRRTLVVDFPYGLGWRKLVWVVGAGEIPLVVKFRILVSENSSELLCGESPCRESIFRCRSRAGTSVMNTKEACGMSFWVRAGEFFTYTFQS